MQKYLWSFARVDRLGVCDFSLFTLLWFCSGILVVFWKVLGWFFFFGGVGVLGFCCCLVVCCCFLGFAFGFAFLFFVYLCFAFAAVFRVLLALNQKLLFKVCILH